jgi:hypothetical protein
MEKKPYCFHLQIKQNKKREERLVVVFYLVAVLPDGVVETVMV